MSTFVTVGNATQPFSRMLASLADVVDELPTEVVVQSGHTPFAHPGCRVEPFLSMDRFEELVSTSTVLIMHAGAGSIIHAVQAGHRPIVMPRRMALDEHVDDHQLELAEALASRGRIAIAHDTDDLRRALKAHRQGETDRASLCRSEAAEAVDRALRSFL